MSRKLLVADESIIMHKTVEHILSDKDYTLEVISDSEEALRIIKDEVPDIVLADVDLPEINGYELCSAIKRDDFLSDIHVILLAAAVNGINEEKVKEAGADDYIIKPFEPEELLNKIDAAVASKDMITQLGNETQRLRKKLHKTEKELAEINRELLHEKEAAQASNDVISQLGKELQRAEEKADTLNRELSSENKASMALEDSIAELRNKLQQFEEKTDKTSKELIEKILLQSIPEITDRTIHKIIEGPLMAEFMNAIKNKAEEKIPYIVEKVITDEIERIKREKDK